VADFKKLPQIIEQAGSSEMAQKASQQIEEEPHKEDPTQLSFF
jgi:hypothetical protein